MDIKITLFLELYISVINTSLKWKKRTIFIHFWSKYLQFLNNVIIIKTKLKGLSSLRHRWPYIVDFGNPFANFCSKYKLFVFQIFRFWVSPDEGYCIIK
jgi:hypothetical protein